MKSNFILLLIIISAAEINAQTGNVGIGIATPGAPLHVHNNTSNRHIYLSGQGPSIRFFPGTTWNDLPTWAGQIGLATTVNEFVNTSMPGDFIVQALGSQGNLIFGTNHFPYNGIERMRVNGIGNVGIATTSPTAKFHVNCVSPVGPSNVRFENLQAGTGYNLVIDQNGYVYKSGSTSAMQASPATTELINLRAEVDQLRKELGEMKKLLEQKSGTQRITR